MQAFETTDGFMGYLFCHTAFELQFDLLLRTFSKHPHGTNATVLSVAHDISLDQESGEGAEIFWAWAYSEKYPQSSRYREQRTASLTK